MTKIDEVPEESPLLMNESMYDDSIPFELNSNASPARSTRNGFSQSRTSKFARVNKAKMAFDRASEAESSKYAAGSLYDQALDNNQHRKEYKRVSPPRGSGSRSPSDRASMLSQPKSYKPS
mmetsp:Transcript_24245/g.37380  ORF Transcript_24245/g.37380 Transcript_24245/m.37380 type:complete len:121 (+) Transcript_24245:301-663(+)